jgi:sulfite oxidase
LTLFDKHPATIVRTEQPFNAGSPLDVLREQFITPSDRFFVRNHGDVPQIDLNTYRLVIDGLVQQPLQLSFSDLTAQFTSVTLAATLQCAGNRRDELMTVKPIPGELPWNAEAISTGLWRGVRLRDVLEHAGVGEGAEYAAFISHDRVERHGNIFGFGGSVPIDKALSDEVLLAYELNNAPLAPTHGFPLRIVAPGYIGARSVKWLAGITLQPEPSSNYFQQHAYKVFPPDVSTENVDWTQGQMLGELAINAVICRPSAAATIPAGPVTVQGYAIAGREGVVRVEVSGDGGITWGEASLSKDDQPWAWCFWETKLDLKPGRHQLIVRAWDGAGRTQPEQPASVWNVKGYMNNAWHRVDIMVE